MARPMWQALPPRWSKPKVNRQLSRLILYGAEKTTKPKKEAEVPRRLGGAYSAVWIAGRQTATGIGNLKAKETRLEEIANELQSILDDLGEEEKVDLINDDNDAFIARNCCLFQE